MEGRLRDEKLEVVIDTKCAHCDAPISLRVDSELHYEVLTPGAAPMVFEPHVDWSAFKEPNIIGAY